MTQVLAENTGVDALRKPRLGFLGVGWIGRHRLRAVVEGGAAEVVAVADADPQAAEAACAEAVTAARCDSLEALLEQGLDGLVIATPSALHAEQAIAALHRGVSVFCQKPLGRTAAETAAAVQAARRADRLLGVDLSYRHTCGYQTIRRLIAGGELGDVYAIELVFHNAYGPDKPWFRDPALSGGGCVIDLGVHLVDLALGALGWPQVEEVTSQLFERGRPLVALGRTVENYAVATLSCADGSVIRLACSWNLPAGCDAVIAADFYGTAGGASLRNVKGSFYDFVATRHRGTACETLVQPPDAWGGRAIAAWAERLARDRSFDPAAEQFVRVAEVIDRIYGR